MIQLALTLKMTTTQVVETSVTVNNNSPIQDYVHPDDQTQPTFEMTPGLDHFNIEKFQIFNVQMYPIWGNAFCDVIRSGKSRDGIWHFCTTKNVNINSSICSRPKQLIPTSCKDDVLKSQPRLLEVGRCRPTSKPGKSALGTKVVKISAGDSFKLKNTSLNKHECVEAKSGYFSIQIKPSSSPWIFKTVRPRKNLRI